jgi:DNA-binding NtrC family response regulator
VLLVDADQCFRSGLAENLRDDGHEVRDYAGPEEVPLLAALPNIAVAVLDYSPPNPDRLALADALHLARPQTAVIMVTAYYSDPDETEIGSRPFLHLQSRPLEYEVLHDLIHRLCDRPLA